MWDHTCEFEMSKKQDDVPRLRYPASFWHRGSNANPLPWSRRRRASKEPRGQNAKCLFKKNIQEQTKRKQAWAFSNWWRSPVLVRASTSNPKPRFLASVISCAGYLKNPDPSLSGRISTSGTTTRTPSYTQTACPSLKRNGRKKRDAHSSSSKETRAAVTNKHSNSEPSQIA